MPAFIFRDHPVADRIRKNLDMAGVFVRAARNQRWAVGAGVAAANAREAYKEALELVRSLSDSEQGSWESELSSLDAAIQEIERS